MILNKGWNIVNSYSRAIGKLVIIISIMIFMTFFLVKYLAKGAGTEAK